MKATDYLKKFSLNGKLAFVVGGLGLIGSEISIALSSAGAKTIILDLDSEKAKKLKKEMREPFYKIYYRKLDCVDMERHEENFKTLMAVLVKAKPASSKGHYVRGVSVSTTMGVGVRVAYMP